MAAKTTKPTVVPAAAPAPKLTAADVLERFEEYVADDIKAARRALKQIVDTKRDEVLQIFSLLEEEGADKSDAKAAYTFTQLYWGLGDGCEAAGKLRTLTEVQAIYEALKADEEFAEPRALLEGVKARVTEMALDDYRRVENSTNPISNAMAASAGVGRGEVYRDAARRCHIFLAMLDKATA